VADDSDLVSAWSALLRVHAAVVPKLARALQRVGLPISWYDVLLVLNAAPGYLDATHHHSPRHLSRLAARTFSDALGRVLAAEE
jgi:hypothetical protein